MYKDIVLLKKIKFIVKNFEKFDKFFEVFLIIKIYYIFSFNLYLIRSFGV